LDAADASVPQNPVPALTRVTFCFAWLFGLEPFLTATPGSSSEDEHALRRK
jgi:hypothetical protein